MAEQNLFNDPSTSLSKLRLLVEKLTGFILEFEQEYFLSGLSQYERLKELEYKGVIPRDIIHLFHQVRKTGNKASHHGEGSTSEAKYMIRQTLKIIKWFYSIYENEELVYAYVEPKPEANPQEQITRLEEELAQAREEVKNFEDKFQRLTQLSKAQKDERNNLAAIAVMDLEEDDEEVKEHIDWQLREAGWECDSEILNHQQFGILPEEGRMMAIADWPCGNTWADYALFIGKELYAVIEAKKHIKNPNQVLDEARNFSIAVDGLFDIRFPDHPNDNKYRVPFVFASNGHQGKQSTGIWFWDAQDVNNRDESMEAWMSPDELRMRLNA